MKKGNMPRYWLSITTPVNFASDRIRKFVTEGFAERYRHSAEKVAVGDRFVLYVNQISRFGAITEAVGEMYHDTEPIWQSASPAGEVYPLRVPIKPIIVLPDEVLLDVRLLVPQLSFIPEGLKPSRYGAAFRVFRPIPESDYQLIESRMREVLESYEAQSIKKPVAKKRLLGPPLNFRALQHEPINEQGVVYLFGMVAREIGFLVEGVATEYPDCEAKRETKNGFYERVRIEFEYRASNFITHKHDSRDCDLIVCWHNDWPGAPVEVLELRSLIQELPA